MCSLTHACKHTGKKTYTFTHYIMQRTCAWSRDICFVSCEQKESHTRNTLRFLWRYRRHVMISSACSPVSLSPRALSLSLPLSPSPSVRAVSHTRHTHPSEEGQTGAGVQIAASAAASQIAASASALAGASAEASAAAGTEYGCHLGQGERGSAQNVKDGYARLRVHVHQ